MSTPEPLQVTSALTGPAALENATIPVVKGGARRPLAVVLASVVDRGGLAEPVGLVVVVDRRAGAGLVVAGSVAAGFIAVRFVATASAFAAVVDVDVDVVVLVVVFVVEPEILLLGVTGVTDIAGVVLAGRVGSTWCGSR